MPSTRSSSAKLWSSIRARTCAIDKRSAWLQGGSVGHRSLALVVFVVLLATANCAEGGKSPADAVDDGAVVSDVPPSRPEMCNGFDDDGDGLVDEDVAPVPCPLQAGVCRGAYTECRDGVFQDCVDAGLYGPDFENVNEADESCDGLDNNCSGGYREGASPEEIDAHCYSD